MPREKPLKKKKKVFLAFQFARVLLVYYFSAIPVFS